jgi:hypothetical protein
MARAPTGRNKVSLEYVEVERRQAAADRPEEKIVEVTPEEPVAHKNVRPGEGVVVRNRRRTERRRFGHSAGKQGRNRLFWQ